MLLLDTVALFLLADIVPGFEIQTWAAAVGMAVVLGVLNALVWPVLARFTLPLSVLTLGLSALVLNGALVALAARISPGGAVALDPGVRGEIEAGGDELPELSVMASGNLGLVNLPREPGRVTLERMTELHPRLLPALVAHPGVAFVLVRSEQGGPVALGADGAHWVAEGRVEGFDPLGPFGPNAAAHVLRTDGFPHCPDLVLNSTYWPQDEEVAAFEELVGSHGGMGGTQSHPFVLFPADLPYPHGGVVGPDTMHRVLRGWLAHVGQEAYASGADAR